MKMTTISFMDAFNILSMITLLVLEITGNWPGKGTGWEDLDELKRDYDAKQQTTTTTTTLAPIPIQYINYNDPKYPKGWDTGTPIEFKDIKIKKIPNNYGLVVARQQNVCFPNQNWIIESEFDPTTAMNEFLTPVDGLENILKYLYYESIDGKKTEAGYTPIANKNDGNNLMRLR